MANDTNRRRKFYDQMSESYDLGSFEEFDKKMDDAASRKRLHEFIDKDGKYDIGTFEYFDEAMRPESKPSGMIASTVAPQTESSAKYLTRVGGSEQGLPEGVYYSDEVMQRHNSPKNQKGNYKDLSQIAREVAAAGGEAYTAEDKPSPLLSGEPKIELPFMQGATEREDLKHSPNLNKYWANAQQEAARRALRPEAYDFEYRMKGWEEAAKADAIRKANRGEFDQQHLDDLYKNHVAPAFKQERAAGEQRAREQVNKMLEQPKVPDNPVMATSGFQNAFNAAVISERETDPAKIAEATIKRVQQDDAFGDYVLKRMGISDQGGGQGESEPLSEREKKFMQLLFSRETSEVADQLIQRMYDQYKAAGAPKNALEYIADKAFHENMMASLFDAMVRRVAGSSGMRQQLRAMASEEYGDEASFATRMLGGAAPFAVDLATGAFTLPSIAGGIASRGLMRGGAKILSKQVTKELEKRAAARGLEDAALREAASGGADIAERYLATQSPIMNIAVRSVGSAANFGTYDVQNGLIRQFGEGEFDAGELFKEAVHGAMLGGVMGVAGGSIANATRNSGLAGRIAGDIAGITSEVGIFAAANGIQKAMDEGISITDVDWADTTGEALGMVAGMKLAGMVSHPSRELFHRYQKSKDFGMQLNRRDIDELKQAGYDFDGIFQGLGQFGKIAPVSKTITRGMEGVQAKSTDQTNREAYIDTTAYNELMKNPNIASSTKRKIAYIATGQVLSVEPAFSVMMNNDNGHITVTTKNVFGNVIETRDYTSEKEAQRDYAIQKAASRINTIDGLERVAAQSGYPDVISSAKDKTMEETGINVDDALMGRVADKQQSELALDTYVRNLSDAYNSRYSRALEDATGMIHQQPEGESGDGSAPQRTERRQEAYERGKSVSVDEGQLADIGYESQLSEARLMQVMPDGEQSGIIRQQIMDALDAGDTEAAETILQRQSPNLSEQQREAIESYIDTFETSFGVDDAVSEMTEDYEQQRREELSVISDDHGNITRVILKDGTEAYYQAGDLNGFHSQVIVTNDQGETRQISSSDIQEVVPSVSAEDVLSDDVRDYSESLRERYQQLTQGNMLLDGQQTDIAIGNQLFRVTNAGQDDNGNYYLQMPDGSQMPMTPQQLSQFIAAAKDFKIQQELAQERQANVLRQRTERFMQNIVGYEQGTPDLTAKDTKPEVAAEFLLAATGPDGEPVDRKTVLDNIQTQVDQLNNNKQQTQAALQQARNDMVMADDGEADAVRQRTEQLENLLSAIDAQRRKWGEIRQAMMTDEERQAYEKDRIKAVSSAKIQSKKDAASDTEAIPQSATQVPTAKELVAQYPERGDGEAFVEEQRKQLSQQYRNYVYPTWDNIQKRLDDYQHGLSDLSPEEIKQLTDEQARLEALMSQMVDQQNAWKKLTKDLGREYGKIERENMTPHELAMSRLQNETDRAKKIKLAQEAFKDDEMALNVLDNLEPQDINEFVAANLGAGSINWEGLQRGEHYVRGLRDELGKDKTRGIGAKYDTNAYNQFLAPEGQGKGIDEIVHSISEGSPYDPQDVKNALLTMLSEATKPTDISHYIENSRIAEAESIYEANRQRERDAELEAEDEAIRQMTGMEPDEYDAFMGDLEQRLAEQEGYKTSEEYFKNILEDERAREERSLGGSQEASAVGMQKQEGDKAGASQEGQGGTGEADEQLKKVKKDIDVLSRKYNSLAPVETVDSRNLTDEQIQDIAGLQLTPEEIEEGRELLRNAKTPSFYSPFSKKIYIFADKYNPDETEEWFFHENVHRGLDQYYGDNPIEVAEAFWNTESPTKPEVTAKHKEAIQRVYADKDEATQHEEYLVHMLGHYMTTGKVDHLLERMSPEHQEIIENILKNVKYDTAKESATRNQEEAVQLEGGNEEDALQQKGGNERGRVGDTTKGEDLMHVPFADRLQAAKGETNVNPTEEQKKAGNYKMGHVRFGGYRMSIENPKGSTRSGVDKNSQPWSIEMQDSYGYIGQKYGTDGDHLDFFINDDADLDTWNGRVYVVDQKNEDGTFDEHKVMYGYPTFAAAKRAYERNYEPGWWDKHVMQMTGMKKENFDQWLSDSDHKRKPFAEYSRTRHADTVSSNVDQLLSDIKAREEATPQQTQHILRASELEGKSADELRQLRKKEMQDRSMAKVLLGTTDAVKDTEKERILQDNIMRAEVNIKSIDEALKKQADAFRQHAEQMEIGGAMVDRLEDMGFEVSTNPRENRRIRKIAEKDNSEEGKMRHFETRDGQIYGFTYKGKMYLDVTKIDAELPIHEYAHPWCEAFRRLNPEGWKNIVDLMKGDKDTWDFIKAINSDLKSEDDIAEEMIAKFSGKKGEERARAEYERMNSRAPEYKSKWGNIWQNISKAIQDFWKQVGDFLHIKYKSTEQVYDQVVRDFANKINPRKRVEDWLKKRDQEYLDAVEKGDEAKAKELFDAALRENIGNGITPFVAVDGYRGKMQKLAHGVKTRDAKVIAQVADLMAPLIPKDAVLVPASSHTGKATDMLDLANAISERTGAPVADVLTSGERGSQYEAKYAGRPLSADEMGIIAATESLPTGKIPVVIDNVVDTGNTAEACVQALGKGIVASLANSVGRYKRVASLKSAEPVVTDKNGEVVPLSRRFELGRKADVTRQRAGQVMPEFMIEEGNLFDNEDFEEPATVVSMPKINKYGLNEASPIGKKLTDLKQQAGEKTIVGYVDSETGNYVVLGNDAALVEKAAGGRGITTGMQDGMPSVTIVSDFDILSPRMVRDGYKFAFTTDEIAPVKEEPKAEPTEEPVAVKDADTLMQEVERRQKVAEAKADKKAADDAVKKFLARQPKNEEEKIRQRATKAVLKTLDNAGVPYKVVSKEEENQMMKLFSMMNQEAVKAFARRVDIRSQQPHGVGKYCVYNMNNPFGVPIYAEKLSVAKFQQEQLQRMVPDGEWAILNIGYADETEEPNDELKKAADMQAEIEALHGTGYVFTKFDHSHMGKGAGSQVFGWGTYLTSGEKIARDYANTVAKKKYNEEVPNYNGTEVFYKGEKIDLDQSKLDPLRLAYDTLNSEGTIRKAITFVERLMDYAEEQDMKDTWQQVLDILKNSKKSDFKVRKADMTDRRYIYKVEIPEDTGENYLDWMVTIKKPLRRKIADAVRQLDGEPQQSFIFTNYKNGWQSLADMIEREQFAYKEIHDRLLLAFGGRVKDAEKVSKLMNSLGFVGVKYPAGTIWGGGDGATNYVIFNEDDAKITDTIQFMIGDESENPIGEKEVRNVVVDTTKTPLPNDRKEALEAVSKMKRPFINDDQGKEIKVFNQAVKHTAMQDHDRSDVRCLGVIDEIIKYAVKIGNEEPAEDEKGHTNDVEIYYCPVNIDGVQYSARLVVKRYENRGLVLDDYQLYDLSAKEKTDAVTRATGQNALTSPSASVPGYKVKELIHSTQENDQKLLGIDKNSTSFQKEGKRILGWSDGKQVYLTEAGLNPNTPVHECTHLWDKWCMKEQPELWKKLVAAMKKTAMWEEISKNPNYRSIWNDEDRMASEVHSRLSGAQSEEEFTKAAFKKDTPQGIINEVKSVLRKFWERILQLFGKHSKTIGSDWDSLDAIVRMPLRDLINEDFEKMMRVAGEDAVSSVDLSLMEGDVILKTLMGVHNISEDKLKKAIKQGGLTNPSLAIINTQNGIHTSYGEISLIPKASLIDSKTGRNAGTYTGDAYTPTYPNVQRMITKQGEKSIQRIAKEVAGGDAELEQHLKRNMYDYAEGNASRLHLLYLLQKGIKPDFLKERTTHSQEEYDAITKIFGKPQSNLSVDFTDEQGQALVDLMADLYEKKLRESEKPGSKFYERIKQLNDQRIKKYRDGLVDENGRLWFAKGDNFIYENWRDEKRRQNAPIDWYGTDNEASYRVAKEGLSEDYEKWKEGELFGDGDFDEKLFAGWTPDGNKRYVANTIENASRLMNKEADTNAYDEHGLNATKSSLLKRLTTLSDIRKAKHLLKDEEVYNETQKEMSDELFDIIHQLSDMQVISDNSFMNIDYAEARLQEAITKRDPIAYLNKEFGYDIAKDSEYASQLMNFIEKAKELPAKYFETKFKRPVGLGEFAIAVVPENTSPDVIQSLKDAGLEVHTYDGTDEGRKVATMNAVGMRNDILFHIEDDDDTIARLEREPKEIGYRNVVQNEDGSLGSPMANRLGKKGVGRKATTPFEYGKWERSDEHPELATEDGKIDLIKPGNKEIGGVDYNPYIHIRPNKVNKQFKQAWERPNLIYVETEYPKSELEGNYKAEKAALPVGKHPWGGGELILSRWDKPVRMVPWEEVADDWEKEFAGRGVEFDIIPPKLLPILAERGVKILPPHKGMGKACNEAYEAWKEKADVTRQHTGQELMRRGEAAIETVNAKFNKDLESLNDKSVLMLGSPSQVLLSTGIKNKPMKLYGTKLIAKAKKHGYEPTDIKNLPSAVASPLAVFTGSHPDSFAILTVLKIKGNNVLVSISPTNDVNDVDFNIISSVYDKKANSVLRWINEGKGLYYDKEKALTYLRHSTPIVETTDKQELDSAANIVNNFENPKLSDEKIHEIYPEYTEAGDATAEQLGGVGVIWEQQTMEPGTKGWYNPNDNTVHVAIDEVEDVDDVKRTVFHEKLGHEGLVALLGSQAAVNKFGSFVFGSASKATRQRIMEKADEIDPQWTKHDRFSKAAQEVLADIAADGPKTADEFDLWTKVKHYLIRFLNKIGLRIRGLLNDHDLSYYILKTGEALKRWDKMSDKEKADMMQQSTGQEILRSRRGKPRKRNNESDAQYFQRLREWEKWRIARQTARDNGDPEPTEEQFHQQAEADFKAAMEQWRRDHNIGENESLNQPFPRRNPDETPQEYAVRVADFESQHDLWATAPQYMDFISRANEKYRRAYTEWRERYDLQEEASVDQRLYEGDIDPEPTFTDAEVEARELAEKELADELGYEIDEEGAKRMAKLAVIERRKNFESANAEDAIWVYDFMKQTDAVAKQIAERTGQKVTGKEIREALPFLIEADRRKENMDAEREDAIMAINMSEAIQQAHSFVDYYNLDEIDDELKALNDAWQHQEAEPDVRAKQAYREAAARLAEKLNSLNADKAGYNSLFADDVMQIRSLLTSAAVSGNGAIMPEHAERFADMPEMQPLMEHVKEWYDEFFQVLEDAGLRGDAGYIEEGYVNHVWDKEKSDASAWEKYIENRQRTKSPNMRHREIDTYMDGISVGLVPKYTDIADMIAHYSRQNNEAVANSKFLDDLKFVYVQELNDAGEVVAILPLLKQEKPDAMLRDHYAQYYVPGVGDVYVMKPVQKRFANIFGTMRTPDAAEWLSKLGKAYDLTSSTAKKIQLALSGFHALALFEVDVAQNNPAVALKHLLKYIVGDSFKSGTLPAYAHPEDFQLAAKHLVQLGATEDYAAADVNAITARIRETFKALGESDEVWKKAAGVAGSPAAIFMDWINKGFDTVLWNYLHDGLKLSAFKQLVKQVDSRVEKEGLDDKMREQLLDEAGQYVNDMFGGQYWELLNISPATLKWMRRLFLSPDWLLSTQRHFFANFGIGSVYSDGGFREYVKYNWDNIKRAFGSNTPHDELRRLRSKNAKYCYLVGALVWWHVFYNAINALCRWMDEEDEKEKAEEERKTNPAYKSPYELAYPNGMKWYDYTMWGNTIGQQTHLFTGRYSDGTETYVRWGKQFREFPELFMGRHGIEFPAPLIQRMMSKANPNIGTAIDFLGAQNIGGFNGSYENKELREKYGKTVATLAATARHFIPFGMPTQAEKEYKLMDFFMPSSKGFSRWKAKDYFESFILDGDWDGIEATYQACVMNGVDAEKNLDAAIASIKAAQKKELADGIVDLTTAAEKFDAATTPEQRKLFVSKLKKQLKGSEYKTFTKQEAIEKVQSFLDGGEKITEKDNANYLMQATSEDIIAEERLKDLGRKAKQYIKAVDNAPVNDQEAMEKKYAVWFDIDAIVSGANSDVRAFKKEMNGKDDMRLMDDIRKTIRDAQSEIDKLDAPK